MSIRRCHTITKSFRDTWILLIIAAVLRVEHAVSWIPPHPKSKNDWESVHDMRRRLGVGYEYSTGHIHAEICRYLTEEECKEVDEAMQEHAIAHKDLARTVAARNSPNRGTIKVCLSLIVWYSSGQDTRIISSLSHLISSSLLLLLHLYCRYWF
jgi:hypothetical protein